VKVHQGEILMRKVFPIKSLPSLASLDASNVGTEGDKRWRRRRGWKLSKAILERERQTEFSICCVLISIIDRCRFNEVELRAVKKKKATALYHSVDIWKLNQQFSSHFHATTLLRAIEIYANVSLTHAHFIIRCCSVKICINGNSARESRVMNWIIARSLFVLVFADVCVRDFWII
jgi:hypothetical protein